jgi:hypothetical protein
VIELRLTRAEYVMACNYACLIESRYDGKRDRTDPGRTRERGYAQRIESTAAEFALATWLELPIELRFVSGKGDVGPYEVRWTGYDKGRLIVRPDDFPQLKYVLVTGGYGLYRFHGWLYGSEAQRELDWLETYNGRPASYFVPQSALHPMERLVSQDPHELETLFPL